MIIISKKEPSNFSLSFYIYHLKQNIKISVMIEESIKTTKNLGTILYLENVSRDITY